MVIDVKEFFSPNVEPKSNDGENVCWFYFEFTLDDKSIKCKSKLDVEVTSVPSG